jgi:hypothetical protein
MSIRAVDPPAIATGTQQRRSARLIGRQRVVSWTSERASKTAGD